MKLSIKQIAFIRNILRDPDNREKAVIDAGYSEKGATVQASRLLNNVNIKAIIDKQIDAALNHDTPFIKRKLQKEYLDIALSDMTDYIDETGAFTDAIKKKSKTGAIQSMEFHDKEKGGGLKKLTLHPKLPAMEKLANLVKLGNPEKGGEADELARQILGVFEKV